MEKYIYLYAYTYGHIDMSYIFICVFEYACVYGCVHTCVYYLQSVKYIGKYT